MPLNTAAICNVIKGTTLCSGMLTRSDAENSLHCVMGELLYNLGATNRELNEVDGSAGTYWNNPIIQKYKPALAEKFGIETPEDISTLVSLNDRFRPTKSTETRTCYIMKRLLWNDKISTPSADEIKG